MSGPARQDARLPGAAGWFLLCAMGLALSADGSDRPSADADAPIRMVTAVPDEARERLNLDPFYEQHVDADGFSIIGSKRVSPYALLEAAYLVDRMLSHRPDLRRAMIASKTRLAVMAPTEMTTHVPEHRDLAPPGYWDKRARGLGATRQRPAVSCAEENLLCLPGDPYSTENILIHEFAHAIHQMGLDEIDAAFDTRLTEVYSQAIAEGLWKGTYAAKNRHEYWAEGAQSWFDTNRPPDGEHNDVDTREELQAYDPRLAALCESVFGPGDWRYQRPDRREQPRHLKGFDRERAGTFAWPRHVSEAFEALQKK